MVIALAKYENELQIILDLQINTMKPRTIVWNYYCCVL